MALIITMLGAIGAIVFFFKMWRSYKIANGNEIFWGVITLVMAGIYIASSAYGLLMGFIPYSPSDGVHTGKILAVDREEYFGNKYRVYLKTSQLTTQSDEIVYKLYNDEIELAEKAENLIGKEVIVRHSFPGGYISAWSAGKHHIDSIELVDK